MTHRNGLKNFYKNRKFKVITKGGSLIDNKSRDLIERSGTANIVGASFHNDSKHRKKHHQSDYSSMLTSNMQDQQL